MHPLAPETVGRNAYRHAVLSVIGLALLLVTSPSGADSYDLRDLGRVTPVGDQSELGCCWAFAACASLESNLLTHGLASGAGADLSEWHVATMNGMNQPDYTYPYDSAGEWGGNRDMAAAYFARGQGPTLEANAHYPLARIEAHQTLTAPPTYLAVAYGLRAAYELDFSNYGLVATHRNALKNALASQGALATSMYIQGDVTGSPYFDPASNGWRYGGAFGANHGVTLVGWDDGKAITVGGTTTDGAWLVKNSWGEDFGEDGYFWVAYEDAVIAETTTSFVADPAGPYADIGQNQDGYANGRYGTSNGNWEEWAAARFTVETSAPLKAVGLWAVETDQEITVEIYDSWADLQAHSNAVETRTVTLEHEGYQSVSLGQPLELPLHDEFFVAIGFGADPSLNIPIEADSSAVGGKTFHTYRHADTGIWDGNGWQDFANADRVLALKALFGEFLPGDADADGDVDIEDLSILASNWDAPSGMSWSDGDFDADGDVDIEDLSQLAANWNVGVSASQAYSYNGSIPEPGSLVLLAPGAAAFIRGRGIRAR